METGAKRTLDEVIGANLRARRAGVDLKQPDVAEVMTRLGQTKWSAATVSRAEAGKRSVSMTELLALSFALGATLEELLDPVAFGDESDVDLLGVPFPAWRLQALLRGKIRFRVHPDGGFQAGTTERGGPAAVLAFQAEDGAEFLRVLGESR